MKLALLLAALSLPLSATITAVNIAVGENSTGSSVASIATAATSHTAGNALVACVRLGVNPGDATFTLANTAGDTWHLLTHQLDTAIDVTQCGWTVTAGNASDVVTATFSTSQPFSSIFVRQYHSTVGFTGASIDADVGQSNGNATTPVTATFSTVASPEALIGFFTVNATGETFSVNSTNGVCSVYTCTVVASDASTDPACGACSGAGGMAALYEAIPTATISSSFMRLTISPSGLTGTVVVSLKEVAGATSGSFIAGASFWGGGAFAQ